MSEMQKRVRIDEILVGLFEQEISDVWTIYIHLTRLKIGEKRKYRNWLTVWWLFCMIGDNEK